MTTGSDHPITWCEACIDYAEARQPVLVPAVMRQAAVEDDLPSEVLLRFLNRVHDRHQRGLPIMPKAAS